MKKITNETHIEGLVYEHSLNLKVSGDKAKNPGVQFINGELSIATDDACLNIVKIHYTYVTAKTSKGNSNNTFDVLSKIINGQLGTVMAVGKENAAKVRCDSAIGVNDFYSDKSGQEELITAKRNEGGFIHVVDNLNKDEKLRNTFKCDMVITNTMHVDANEDKGLPEKLIIKGCTFDFRNGLLPVEFSATNPNAITYFEGLEASKHNPIFTTVWGRQISETIVRQITTESAFGDADIREVTNTRKDWVVTGAAREPFVWDDESTITAAELTDAIAKREVYLAEVKQRSDEYKASKNQGSAGVPSGGFNF